MMKTQLQIFSYLSSTRPANTHDHNISASEVLIWYSVIMQIKTVHRDDVTQIWKRIMMSLITGSTDLTPPHAAWLGMYCNWETDYKYSLTLNIVREEKGDFFIIN